VSIDVEHWVEVAQVLAAGQNPYVATTHLNWPPLWMMVVYLLNTISSVLAVPFSHVLWAFLISADLVALVLFRVAAIRGGIERPDTVLLWGVALNPISIVLTCQHGNFDVLVAAALACFLIALHRYVRDGQSADWLVACAALGVGILVKTVPVVLAPLLLARIAIVPVRFRAVGAFLVTFPAAVGTGTIYVLAPAAVTQKVLQYQSFGGYFGITGILDAAGHRNLAHSYASIFPWVLLATLFWTARHFAKTSRAEPRKLVLTAALLLCALATFGGGYGSQYIAWYLPLFVLTYPSYGHEWKRVLIAAYAVAICTYAVEYGLFFSHGALLLHNSPPAALLQLASVLQRPAAQTLVRLPLFLAQTGVILLGLRLLVTESVRPQVPARDTGGVQPS